jgi:hypothetical protein
MKPTELKPGDVLRNIHGTPYNVKEVRPKKDGTGFWVIAFNMNGEHWLPYKETDNVLFRVIRNDVQISA